MKQLRGWIEDNGRPIVLLVIILVVGPALMALWFKWIGVVFSWVLVP